MMHTQKLWWNAYLGAASKYLRLNYSKLLLQPSYQK